MKAEQLAKTTRFLEKKGKEFYEKCSKITKDDEGKNTFQDLAKEKEKRLQEIEEVVGELCVEGEALNVIPNDMYGEVPGGKVHEEADILDALNIGINSSRRALEIYQEMKDVASDEKAKELLEKVIEREEHHLSMLEEERKSLTKTGEWHDFRIVTC